MKLEQEDLNAAMQTHLKEIAGVPLSIEDITMRFVIYGSMLTQYHEMDDDSMRRLLKMSKEVQLQLSPITNATAH